MMVIKKILLTAAALIMLIGTVSAQQPTAEMSIDTNNVLIGDRIKLKLEFESQEKLNVVWPVVGDTIGALEVVNRTAVDTLQKEGTFLLRQLFDVTAFDSGRFFVPPFTVMYEKEGHSSLYPVQTTPVYLKYNLLELDSTASLVDIKKPMEDPISILEYWYYAVIVLALLVAGYFAYKYWKRRKKEPEKVLDYDPNIPPDILALESLQKLDSEKLWQKGYVKLYYTRLTEIIRLYIHRRHNIPAMEMISSDIIRTLEQKKISDELISEMRDVFIWADLSKFAKHEPLAYENTQAMQSCVNYVGQTTKVSKGNSTENHEDSKKEG